jgi:hypothetical protein
MRFFATLNAVLSAQSILYKHLVTAEEQNVLTQSVLTQSLRNVLAHSAYRQGT